MDRLAPIIRLGSEFEWPFGGSRSHPFGRRLRNSAWLPFRRGPDRSKSGGRLGRPRPRPPGRLRGRSHFVGGRAARSHACARPFVVAVGWSGSRTRHFYCGVARPSAHPRRARGGRCDSGVSVVDPGYECAGRSSAGPAPGPLFRRGTRSIHAPSAGAGWIGDPRGRDGLRNRRRVRVHQRIDGFDRCAAGAGCSGRRLPRSSTTKPQPSHGGRNRPATG